MNGAAERVKCANTLENVEAIYIQNGKVKEAKNRQNLTNLQRNMIYELLCDRLVYMS